MNRLLRLGDTHPSVIHCKPENLCQDSKPTGTTNRRRILSQARGQRNLSCVGSRDLCVYSPILSATDNAERLFVRVHMVIPSLDAPTQEVLYQAGLGTGTWLQPPPVAIGDGWSQGPALPLAGAAHGGLARASHHVSCVARERRHGAVHPRDTECRHGVAGHRIDAESGLLPRLDRTIRWLACTRERAVLWAPARWCWTGTGRLERRQRARRPRAEQIPPLPVSAERRRTNCVRFCIARGACCRPPPTRRCTAPSWRPC